MDERPSAHTALAACGVAGAVLFAVTCVVAGAFDGGFSFADNNTSDLGSLTAAHPGPYNVGLSLSGLLTGVFAIGIVFALGRRRGVIVGAVLVGVFGLGQLIDGLAREDCAVSVDAACRAAEKAGAISTHHKVHNIESLFTFSALLLAPVVFGLVLRSMPRWRRFAWWSFAAAATELVCLPIFLTMYSNGTSGQGILEMVEVAAGVAWIAALSIAILREPAGPEVAVA